MLSTVDFLRRAGLRATNPRVEIFRWLSTQPQAVRVETIWAKLKRSGIDRVTVYRTLETLEHAGLVRTVDFGHGHAHYEVNNPDRHHHHLVCDNCGDVQDVTVQEEDRIIQSLERDHRFKTRSHSFELFGLCAKCI